MQLKKDFSINFNGVQKNIFFLTFHVLEETIVVATEILSQGEKWFKGMPLDSIFYTDFLKPEYKRKILVLPFKRLHTGTL